MYVDPSVTDPNILYQGDIIDDVPFFNVSEPIQVEGRNYDEGMVFAESDDNDNQDYLAVLEVQSKRIMLLSQTCDIQRRDNVIMCPIFEVVELEGRVNRRTINSLKDRKINYWFYLPSHGDLPESFADFQLMQFIPREALTTYIQNRTLTLSDKGRHHLAWSLGTYFMRPA